MVCGFSDWLITFGGDAVTFGKTTDDFIGDDFFGFCEVTFDSHPIWFFIFQVLKFLILDKSDIIVFLSIVLRIEVYNLSLVMNFLLSNTRSPYPILIFSFNFNFPTFRSGCVYF